MIGSIVLPEQSRTFITRDGFTLTIDLLQNAIKEISHPTQDWHNFEESILDEAREVYPGIEIWRNWTVIYSSSSGSEETIEVRALKSDLKDMFPNILSVEEKA